MHSKMNDRSINLATVRVLKGWFDPGAPRFKEQYSTSQTVHLGCQGDSDCPGSDDAKVEWTVKQCRFILVPIHNHRIGLPFRASTTDSPDSGCDRLAASRVARSGPRPTSPVLQQARSSVRAPRAAAVRSRSGGQGANQEGPGSSTIALAPVNLVVVQ